VKPQKKADFSILIVEDDPTLGRSMEEALTRAGFSTLLVQTYSSAKNAFHRQNYNLAILDCMLPQKSGIDLISDIKREGFPIPPLILTSGIFRDRAYSIDAMQETGARTFMIKPFNIHDLILNVEKIASEEMDEDVPPVLQLMDIDFATKVSQLDIVRSLKNVHGYEMPQILHVLMERQFVGKLHIHINDEMVGHISFQGGRIDAVQLPDNQSLFGILLLEKGYVVFDDLQSALQVKDQRTIGQKLIDLSSISPHSAFIVHKEQMNIRLSKLITNEVIGIHLEPGEKTNVQNAIEPYEFASLLQDWINSKIPADWLRTRYLASAQYQIIKGPEYAKLSLLIAVGGLKNSLETITQQIDDKPSVEILFDKLANSTNHDSSTCWRAFHYLLLQKILCLTKPINATESEQDQLRRLDLFWSHLKDKNHFEVLGVNRTTKPSQALAAYKDLAKIFHPDKLPRNASEKVKMITNSIFERLSGAYNTVKDPDKLRSYLLELDHGRTQDALTMERSFEEGKTLLQQCQFRNARKHFQIMESKPGCPRDINVYIIWAYIKERRNVQDSQELSQQLAEMFTRIPHEDRHSAQYFFIRAMYYEITGQIQKAYNSHQHALTIDPDFRDSQREMSYLRSTYKKKHSWGDDITTVMTTLFKKRA
jgi:DNA-binding response OmpR family regulator